MATQILRHSLSQFLIHAPIHGTESQMDEPRMSPGWIGFLWVQGYTAQNSTGKPLC